jgi:hypothetical protein
MLSILNQRGGDHNSCEDTVIPTKLGSLDKFMGSLVDCANTSQYVSLIEEIYNYRRREKVNLRY